MPYAYEGLATVTMLALYSGQPPVELTTEELPIVLRNAGANRARVEFDHYLLGSVRKVLSQAPHSAGQ